MTAIRFLMILTMIPFSYASFSKPSCAVKNFIDCQQLKSTTEPWIPLPDGTKFPNLAVRKDSPIKESDLTTKQKEDAESTFKEVKELILNEILKGRAKNQLSSAELSWVNRISTLTFKGWLRCPSSRPNGKNQPEIHAVRICPGFAVMPKSVLVGVLAHEISHSIDFCNSQGVLYERGPGERDRNVIPNIPGARDSDSLRLFYASSAQYFNFNSALERAGLSQTVINQMVERKLIQSSAEPIAADRYPLKKVLQCIENEKMELNNASVRESDRHLTSQFNLNSTNCGFQESSVQEDSADIWKARISGLYLKAHPIKSDLEKTALLYSSIAETCSKPNDQYNRTIPAHSLDQFRNEHILMSDPNVQQAFGCTPTNPAQQNCLNHFEILTFPASYSQPQKPSQTFQ